MGRRGRSVFWVEEGVEERRTWCGVKSCQTCGGHQSGPIPAFLSAVVGDDSVAVSALDNFSGAAAGNTGDSFVTRGLVANGESESPRSRGRLVGEPLGRSSPVSPEIIGEEPLSNRAGAPLFQVSSLCSSPSTSASGFPASEPNSEPEEGAGGGFPGDRPDISHV